MSATSTRMSLEDYLNFNDGTETQYELVNGELFEVPPESDLNQRIVSFLFAYFLQQGIPHSHLRTKAEIVVSGSRVTVRVPDLMVLSQELAAALKGASRSTVMMDMPPPRLVVEVVSPGKENEDRDYRSNPNYVQVTSYIRKETYKAVRRELLEEEVEFSALVQDLLDKWLEEHRK